MTVVEMDDEAMYELEKWSRYFRSNITDDTQIGNIRRARKALCKSLGITYDERDEVI